MGPGWEEKYNLFDCPFLSQVIVCRFIAFGRSHMQPNTDDSLVHTIKTTSDHTGVWILSSLYVPLAVFVVTTQSLV